MGFSGLSSVSPARPLPKAGYGRADVALPDRVFGPANAATEPQSNLTRLVYCVLGMPIDAVQHDGGRA